jgi:hypothetical protein
MEMQWRSACQFCRMDERTSAHDFLRRLDLGDLDRNLSEEMSKLSYEQLLAVGGWLAERHLARAKGKRAERAPWQGQSMTFIDRH